MLTSVRVSSIFRLANFFVGIYRDAAEDGKRGLCRGRRLSGK